MQPTPSRAEREAYACDAFAIQSFICAHRHIEMYLKLDQNRDFEMCEALTASITMFYLRPFKNRKPLRLDKALVPAKYSVLHEKLEMMRDKFFAHRDTNLPSASWGNANDIGFYIGNDQITPSVHVGLMEPGQAVNLLSLIIELEKMLSPRLESFYHRHIPRDLDDGRYVVSLQEGAGPWFQKTHEA